MNLFNSMIKQATVTITHKKGYNRNEKLILWHPILAIFTEKKVSNAI